MLSALREKSRQHEIHMANARIEKGTLRKKSKEMQKLKEQFNMSEVRLLRAH